MSVVVEVGASPVVARVVLALVLLTFRDYGITWDETWHIVYGDHILEWFLTLGADVSAQGNVTMKPAGSGESTDAMTSFTPYVSVYQIMDKGVNVQANWGGTKYFRDPDLN